MPINWRIRFGSVVAMDQLTDNEKAGYNLPKHKRIIIIFHYLFCLFYKWLVENILSKSTKAFLSECLVLC